MTRVVFVNDQKNQIQNARRRQTARVLENVDFLRVTKRQNREQRRDGDDEFSIQVP